MAIALALSRIRREGFSDLPITQSFEQACRAHGLQWRERLLPPLITFKLFVLQVLHGNTAIAHLRQLAGFDFAPGSYCEARQRLPLALITSLLTSVVEAARQKTRAAASHGAKLIAQRVLIVDGSNFSMSDSAELHAHFHLSEGTKEGIGYPLASILGVIDAATGLFVQMLAMPLYMHEMSIVTQVHDCLQSGDILLGDRAFCSYVHLAMLNARGVLACFRLHQKRKDPIMHGRTRWQRPRQEPRWMKRERFLALPQWIDVRLVSYCLTQKGFRSRRITIATTLLDEVAWPDEKIAQLYHQRWLIEGCFDHLKTTMNMNVLKCKSVEGVLKELGVYLIVYNLVRLTMLRAAHEQRVNVHQISFIDAVRLMACRMLGLTGASRLIVNPRRIGRWEPRVVRRRMKPYDLMTHPRSEMRLAGESARKC